MRLDYPPDTSPSLHNRYWRLSTTARLLLLLGGVFLLQFIVYLAAKEDFVGTFLGLQIEPLDWQACYQIFTYGLVHAVNNPHHILFNSITLFFAGKLLEESRGPKTTLLTFWAGVAVGGIFFGGWEMIRGGGGSILYGASAGAVAVLVSASVTSPNALVFFTIPLWVFAAVIVGIDLMSFALSVRQGVDSSVSYVAHVGGAVTGLLLGRRRFGELPWLARENDGRGMKERFVAKIREHRERAQEDRAREREERLDRILEKIHTNGLGSLSEEEKNFLKQTSDSLQSPSRKKD